MLKLGFLLNIVTLYDKLSRYSDVFLRLHDIAFKHRIGCPPLYDYQ